MRIKGSTSFHNVWLIARREYIERIRTRGFVLTTVMIPSIMAMFIFGSAFLSEKASHTLRIAVVSSDVQLSLDLQEELQREAQAPGDDAAERLRDAKAKPNFVVDAIDPGPNTQARLDRELDDDVLDGYLWITPSRVSGGRPSFSFTPRSSGQGYVRGILAGALEKVLIREQLHHEGVVASDAETMLQPVEVVQSHEAKSDHHESAQVCVSVLFFMMYLVIMLYGMNVARSVIEEKTSRIFEVMLATVRPEAMMAGKLIGVGSVGLTQVGIWISAGLLLAAGSVGVHLGGDTLQFSLTASQVVFFFVYFILGYLFYSSIAAALGAMTNSEQELQQLNMFLMLPLLFCFVMLGTLLNAPDSTLARILSLVPAFTPLLMYMRVSLGHPAVWEVALSIVLTSASICGIIWVTSRIYRVGVLMYGKRPNIPEILRWLKYS